MSRKPRIFLFIIFLPLLVLLAGFIWMIATDNGTAKSIRLIEQFLPQLSVTGIDGHWTSTVTLEKLEWQQEGVQLALKNTRLELEDHPFAKLALRIKRLETDALSLALTDSEDEITKKEEDLPDIKIPIGLFIKKLMVGNFSILRGEDSVFSAAIRSDNLSWKSSLIRAQKLVVDYADIQIRSSGSIDLKNNYLLKLKGNASHPDYSSPVTFATSGNLAALTLQAESAEPYAIQAKGLVNVLAEGIPFTANLVLSDATELQLAERDIQFRTVVVNLEGNIAEQQAAIIAEITENQTGDSTLSTQLELRWPLLAVSELQWQTDAGDLNSQCDQVNLQEISWNCQGQVNALQFDIVEAGKSLLLNSRFSVSGQWQQGLQSLALKANVSDSQFGDKPLSAVVDLMMANQSEWKINHAQLQLADNKVVATGSIERKDQINIDASLNDLSALHADLSGTLSADLKVIGALDQPDIIGSLHSPALSWQNNKLAETVLDINVQKRLNKNSQAQLRVKTFSFGENDIQGIEANFEGSLKQQTLALGVDTFQNWREVAINCSGAMAKQKWQGNCNRVESQLVLPQRTNTIQLRDSLLLSFDQSIKQLAVEPFCLHSDSAQACLVDALAVDLANGEGVNNLTARVFLDGLPLNWLPALPQGFSFSDESVLSGSVNVSGLRPLNTQGNVQTSKVQWRWQDAKTQTERTGGIEEFAVQFTGTETAAEFNAILRSTENTQLDGKVLVSEPMTTRSLSGRVRLNSPDVREFDWLLPEVSDETGKLLADISFSGTAKSPQFSGTIALSEGAAFIDRLGEKVEKLSMDANFENQQVKYRSQFQMAQGQGVLEGTAQWQEDGWSMDAAVNAKQMTLNLPEVGEAKFDANINLGIAEQLVQVGGDVVIQEAEILLNELPEDSAEVSNDAVIVGENNAETSLWRSAVDLKVNLGDKIHFRGFGADLDLNGKLRILSKADQGFSAQGKVSVSRGRYIAYGQRLTVRKGDLVFSGPLDDPIINLEAIRQTPTDQVAGLRVTGSLRHPHAELFSEPQLSETDTAYFLVTGKRREAESPSYTSADGALLLLGVSGASAGAARLAEKVGIHDLQLSADQGESGVSTQISGYITPRLYVRYGTSPDRSQNTLKLQYQLSQRLLLESVSGFNSALDILYTFAID